MYQLISAICFPRNLNLWLSKAIFNDIWVADLDIFYGDIRSSNIFNFLLCGQEKIPSDVKWFISFKIWINLIKKYECNKNIFENVCIAICIDHQIGDKLSRIMYCKGPLNGPIEQTLLIVQSKGHVGLGNSCWI